VATLSARASCCRDRSFNKRFRYERRKPEDTVLYRIIRENLETFLASAYQSEDGREFPAFVEKELRGYLDCGILSSKGFARFKCLDCGREKLAAFSCKGRGFCPSCGGRRMSSLAAHLVDKVIPKVPTRQWVLSLPIRLRYLLAYNHDLCREVVGIFNRIVNQFYRQKGKIHRIKNGDTGSVTFVQRRGGALNLNVHFHGIFIDGIFVETNDRENKTVTFHPAKKPTDKQIAVVVSQIRYEVLCLLRDRGLLDFDFDSDNLAGESPLLAACYNASTQNRVAFGSRAGQNTTRLGNDPYTNNCKSKAESRGKLHAHMDGFDLHARQHIPANDRKQLARISHQIERKSIREVRQVVLGGSLA
jgi:hypothetical protein